MEALLEPRPLSRKRRHTATAKPSCIAIGQDFRLALPWFPSFMKGNQDPTHAHGEIGLTLRTPLMLSTLGKSVEKCFAIATNGIADNRLWSSLCPPYGLCTTAARPFLNKKWMKAIFGKNQSVVLSHCFPWSILSIHRLFFSRRGHWRLVSWPPSRRRICGRKATAPLCCAATT